MPRLCILSSYYLSLYLSLALLLLHNRSAHIIPAGISAIRTRTLSAVSLIASSPLRAALTSAVSVTEGTTVLASVSSRLTVTALSVSSCRTVR